MRILVVNAGSSSLKLSVLSDDDTVLASKDVEGFDSKNIDHIIGAFLDDSPDIDAVGHRVVHGGVLFLKPTLLNESIDESLQSLAELDPLHNPPCLAAIRALQILRPHVSQVACFDTSFHRNMPAKASTYAVPQSWRENWNVRRFGFHGLSHEWASRRASELLGQPREELRLVTAHIGAGASLAAVAFGRSVDTTMGFTPMEGLVMATRSGSVDPGLVLWVQQRGGLSASDVERSLESESGLLGLSKESGDLRRVISSADAGNKDAKLAYDVYVYRIQTNVAAMCAAMNGLNGLVFTGGAGAASSRLRVDVCAGLGFLGVRLDPDVVNDSSHDRIASAPGEMPAVLVVTAREDIEIARSVRRVLR
jgi:acetate kinase